MVATVGRWNLEPMRRLTVVVSPVRRSCIDPLHLFIAIIKNKDEPLPHSSRFDQRKHLAMETTTSIPANANQGCVGPTSAEAGKSEACAGCPNQSLCSSGQMQQNQSQTMDQSLDIQTALSSVSYVLLVLSGKGGVGKSTLCCQMAHTLAARGYQVGVLDVDICGPSVARMMGVTGHVVHKSARGWTPVYTNSHIAVMSVSFLLSDPDSAVVWRGPRKNAMIQQFLSETDWGELDYLLIDTPPGTSDEHISTVQYLQGALSGNNKNNNNNCALGGAIVITTPEEMSMADVRKELNFCKKTMLPVIGVVENMSKFQTRLHQLQFFNPEDPSTDQSEHVLQIIRNQCPQILNMIVSADIFPVSGTGPLGMAQQFGVPYLGHVPLDSNLLKSCEEGSCFVMAYPQSPSVVPLNHIVDGIIQALPLEEVETL